MKAITIIQPWATLIALRKKKFETAADLPSTEVHSLSMQEKRLIRKLVGSLKSAKRWSDMDIQKTTFLPVQWWLHANCPTV